LWKDRRRSSSSSWKTTRTIAADGRPVCLGRPVSRRLCRRRRVLALGGGLRLQPDHLQSILVDRRRRQRPSVLGPLGGHFGIGGRGGDLRRHGRNEEAALTLKLRDTRH
jgi:hypothetical protein